MGVNDLKVAADITGKLNSVQKPPHLRYLVLAGNHSAAANAPAKGRLARLAAKLLDGPLDVVFGEPDHDAVVARVAALKAMGFGWVALNATAIFQAGARSVEAMTEQLATLHDRLRAEIG